MDRFLLLNVGSIAQAELVPADSALQRSSAGGLAYGKAREVMSYFDSFAPPVPDGRLDGSALTPEEIILGFDIGFGHNAKATKRIDICKYIIYMFIVAN